MTSNAPLSQLSREPPSGKDTLLVRINSARSWAMASSGFSPASTVRTRLMRAAGLPSPLGRRGLVGLVASGAALSSSTRRSSAAFDSGLTSSSASTTARFGADAQSCARISALRLRTCKTYALEQLTTDFGKIAADAVEEVDACDAPEVMQEPTLLAHVMKVIGIIDAGG